VTPRSWIPSTRQTGFRCLDDWFSEPSWLFVISSNQLA